MSGEPDPEPWPKGKVPGQYDVLQEVMLDVIGRVARPAQDIFADVRDNYGEVDERRLYNHLNRLVKRGLVVRHPKTLVEAFDKTMRAYTYSRAKSPKQP